MFFHFQFLISSVEQEVAERAEPSDGLGIALRGPHKRSLGGECDESVSIIEPLKPDLCFLC
jgi:hypothetical protein